MKKIYKSWYSVMNNRWKIEHFHFILKSRYKIEKNQAREYERLKFLVLLYSVIALQILNLTYLGKNARKFQVRLCLIKKNEKYYTAVQEKQKKFLKHIHWKKQFMIWRFWVEWKVLRAMVCPEHVLFGRG